MNRAKLLLTLSQQNETACITDRRRMHVVKNTQVSTTSSSSKSLISDAESIKDVISSPSGSEYIPPSESTSASTNSLIIPPIEKIVVTEQQLEEKVTNYLKSLNSNPIINLNNSDLPLHKEQPISIINKNINLGQKTSNTLENNQEYIRKPSARERPTICPICFKDVITHFPRHLLRHHKEHKDIILLRSLKPKSKERSALIASLRKQGYFHLKNEKNVFNPVRNSKNTNIQHFVCTYCLGYYSKKLLSKHVKICKSKPDNINISRQNCLTTSQTFMASIISKNHEFLKNSRIKEEVFSIMRPDNISAVAKNDPLICLYGESLLNKHKRQQITNLISNKIREMARLLISLKKFITDIQGLFDALKPENFNLFILATKDISGYDIDMKTFKSPSLALHMGTNLKMVCDVAFKIVIEKKQIPNITWLDKNEKKTEIKELRKLIDHHWCTELSSLALKDMKEKQWNNPTKLPLTSDIKIFHEYLNTSADNAFNELNSTKPNVPKNYRILTECVLALTVMFNRKRIGDVQYLKIESYTQASKGTDQEDFVNSLTPLEKILCKKFKRVVTGGKGSKPVPILFSNKLQKFVNCLIEIRKNTDVVPKSNPYLFANPGSVNRWMSGTNIIRKYAINCGTKNSNLLTSTKFRKHIATTLQLMTMDDSEMEQIATFMGHTKKTHQEFYRLPQDIFQTAKVAKVLLLLEKGVGEKFKGKSINDIHLEKDVYYSSESDTEADDNTPLSERVLRRAATSSHVNEQDIRNETNKDKAELANYDLLSFDKEHELNSSAIEGEEGEKEINGTLSSEVKSKSIKKKTKKKLTNNKIGLKDNRRHRWSDREKKIVLKYFHSHIRKKIAPKKHECLNLISNHGDLFVNLNWVQIKTFVYNAYQKK